MIIHLPPQSTRLHLLRTPLRRTADREKAERSRFTWGAEQERVTCDGPARYAWAYTLTPLGILHTLTGLTVCTDTTTHTHPDRTRP